MRFLLVLILLFITPNFFRADENSFTPSDIIQTVISTEIKMTNYYDGTIKFTGLPAVVQGVTSVDDWHYVFLFHPVRDISDPQTFGTTISEDIGKMMLVVGLDNNSHKFFEPENNEYLFDLKDFTNSELKTCDSIIHISITNREFKRVSFEGEIKEDYFDFIFGAQDFIMPIKVSYFSNGGDFFISPHNLNSNSEWLMPDDKLAEKKPEFNDCEFLGWFTDENGGEKISTIEQAFQNSKFLNGNKTQGAESYGINLFAHWKLYINFETNGGNKLDKMEATPNKIVTNLPAPEKENFFFDGWYDENGNLITETSTFNKNTTLYAKWIPFLKISFYDDNQLIRRFNIPKNSNLEWSDVEQVKNLEKFGYEFAGWKNKKGKLVEINDKKIYSQDVDYQAVWKQISKIIGLWDDVVTIDNGKNLFSTFQWYKNDKLIEGANYQYFNDLDGLEGNSYYCVVDSGVVIGPKYFEAKNEKKLEAYGLEGQAYINVQNDDNQSVINIINSSGQVIKTLNKNNLNQNIPLKKGFYIINLKNSNQTIKIYVK